MAATDAAAQVARLVSLEPDVAFRRRVRAVMEFLELRPGDRILDCGCGLGFYLRLLSEVAPGCALDGVDISVQRLGRAIPSRLRENVRLVLGDSYHLPYRDAVFDKVILSEVLEHLPEDVPAVREVARVLKPGGIVAVTVPHQRYPWLYDPINKVLEATGVGPVRTGLFAGIWTDHQRLYRPEKLLRTLEDGGLRPIRWRLDTRYCLPFTHLLVYGLGKWLMDRRWGGDEQPEVDRFNPVAGVSIPLRLMTNLLGLVDRMNDGIRGDAPAVGILVKATRDGQSVGL